MSFVLLINMAKLNTIIYDGQWWDRIDVYLTKNHEYTRNFFHRLMARGDIILNDTVLKKNSTRLKSGDQIIITHPERYMESEVLAQSPLLDLQILIEKQDYIVVYKPKGILSHPNSVRWVEHANIVWALYHYYKKQNLPTTGNFIRAWLIHRLDKQTDGLMLIVKTEEGLKYFKNLFQMKSLAESIQEKELIPLKKYYRAKSFMTTIGSNFLDVHSTPFIIQELVIPRVPHYEPKLGITKIISCKRWILEGREICDFEIEILTGRTHQIRYHLSKYGLPIVGDYLYGSPEDYNIKNPMYLQAYRLSFLDIEWEKIDLCCPLV